MPRLFIAVDLSVAVIEKLAVLQRALERDLPEAARTRWVDAPNIHVTLEFLGDVDESLIPMLDEALSKLVKPLFPFEVRCCRVGAFPDPRKPRIIWAGLDDTGAEVMGLLRQTIERDFAALGFEPDGREYKPHLTLGRVRAHERFDASALDAVADLDFGPSYIKDIVLFESKLTPTGAEYIVRRRYPLGEV